MSDATKTAVARLKQSAHNESVKHWERTNDYPKREINFGWHPMHKIWRLTVHLTVPFVGVQIPVPESMLEYKDCEKLLDVAFEWSETYNTPIGIVVNSYGKIYR